MRIVNCPGDDDLFNRKTNPLSQMLPGDAVGPDVALPYSFGRWQSPEPVLKCWAHCCWGRLSIIRRNHHYGRKRAEWSEVYARSYSGLRSFCSRKASRRQSNCTITPTARSGSCSWGAIPR